MADCLIHRTGSTFKAFIDVRANPNTSVSATLSGGRSFSGTTDANGDVRIVVRKKGTYTVSYTNTTSGGQTASVTITTSKEVKTANITARFTLSISASTGTTITVNRNSSRFAGASTGALSNGNYIYYGDVLSVSTAASSAAYNTPSLTVNSAAFTSGGTLTVSANVTAAATTTVKSYTLSISPGTNSSISVTRTSSPNQHAPTSGVANGGTIYYGDVLSWTYSVTSGYQIATHTVNGATQNSGYSWTVYGNASCITTATLILIKMYCHFNSSSREGQANIWVPKGWSMQQIIANSSYNHARMFSHSSNVADGDLYVVLVGSGTTVNLQVTGSAASAPTFRAAAKWYNGTDTNGDTWVSPTGTHGSSAQASHTINLNAGQQCQLYTT